jgi:hypothetical protein
MCMNTSQNESPVKGSNHQSNSKYQILSSQINTPAKQNQSTTLGGGNGILDLNQSLIKGEIMGFKIEEVGGSLRSQRAQTT